MKDSRLLIIFQQLSTKEIRALDKFVHSPFHNQRKDVILLFQYLRLWRQQEATVAIDKPTVYASLFPKTTYTEKKIRYTMSFLYQLIKDFLAIQTLQSNKIDQQIAVIQSFRKKGINKLFEQELKLTTNLLEKSTLRHQDYYFQNYRLQNEHYLYNTSQTREKTTGLIEYATHLDHFFIINKLRQNARALSHKTIEASEFEPTFSTEILDYLAQIDINSHPAIAIYFHCYQILAAENALPYFRKLRELMSLHHNCFPPREWQDIYTFALNYCIKRLNAQERAFGQEAFELYKEGLKQGIFLENGVLSRFNYKNIVALGLGVKEFVWVKNFLETYRPYLEKKYQESTYFYNLAILHYRTENFDDAMILLQKVKSKDVLNNLDTRRILACIYFDKGEFDALHSLLDSFQNYIYRKRGLGYHRRMYLNFIKYARKLLQLEGMNSGQKMALREEIVGTRNVAEKGWLLERVGV